MKRRIGKYKVSKELGRGGMGEVYLARHVETGQRLALKILPPELTRNHQYVERFRREARAVSKLDHPHIIKVYDVGEEEGIHFFAMEYLGGKTLKQTLASRGRLSIPETVKIITDISDALDFAHSRGIIHRDVKPDNIIADENGEFRIMDFGIARLEEGTQLTVTGTIMGTPEYMSPEQASGNVVDQRTDIYSLGIVFYELMTGKVPFHAETAVEVLQMHRTRIPESPKLLNPEIPGKLATVIGKMVEKKPADRYASFRHVINAIGQAVPKDMRTVVEAPVRAVEAKPAREEKRPGPRARERVILQVPAKMKAALALSIILNVALFGYVLLRPVSAPEPMRPAFNIGGPAFAPPAMSEGKMYLGTEDGTIYACSLESGEVQWTHRADDKITAGAVVDGSRVYVSSWDNYVYALDTVDGNEIWKVNIGDIISATPLLSEGTLYVTTRKGNVFAIDTETGLERWTVNSGGPISFSTTIEDGVLFVPTERRKLVAFRATDGERLGDYPAPDIKTSAIPIDGKLYFVTFNDTANRDELWSFTIMPAHAIAKSEPDRPERRVPLTIHQTE